MARRARYALIAVLCVVLVAGVGAGLTLAARRAQASGRPGLTVTGSRMPSTSCDTWSLVASPNASTLANGLFAVSAVAPTDMWAVGQYYPSSSQPAQTLVEHYNGHGWSIVSSPNKGTGGDGLFGVVALASGNVWAVGNYYATPNSVPQTLIEHWDGTKWSVVPSPNSGTDINTLSAVSAASANDVWAVGGYFSDTLSLYQTLVEHWNGSQWSIIASPNGSLPGPKAGLPGSNQLFAVSADSANDAWAVGQDSSLPLILHWNGTNWALSSPQVVGSTDKYYGVSASAPDDVWAVGTFSNGTLAEHWNGSSWSVVPSPNGRNTNANQLNAVVADPAVYQTLAVGFTGSIGGLPTRAPGLHGPYAGFSPFYTLGEEWDGAEWSMTPSVSPNNFGETLVSVTAVSTGDGWAVGYAWNSTVGADQTLIERYSPHGLAAGPCASR